jgi:precorrin isomerase/sirohydrochlorin ferrochelatase
MAPSTGDGTAVPTTPDGTAVPTTPDGTAVPTTPDGTAVHPIEDQSYRILATRIDLSGWDVGPRAVAARVVHATAEPALVDDLVVDAEAVRAGTAALAGGAPVLCDVEMVRAGISGVQAACALAEVRSGDGFESRTAAAMALLAEQHPDGAVVVVGCAPTALAEITRRVEAGTMRPALVVGVPVGFVGAAEAKDRLLVAAARAGVPAISLRGERGGAAVAAAVMNALVRLTGPGAGPATDTAPAARAPACLVIGHGSRSPAGAEELRRFVEAVAAARPEVATTAGFIEFLEPALEGAVDRLVDGGATSVVAVPLVLLGAGHMKDDGPAALTLARHRHPEVAFSYGRDLGLHPDVLSVVADRVRAATATLPGGEADAVVIVGRGSTDPDANADLVKAARLLADGRRLTAPGPAPAPASARSDRAGPAGPTVPTVPAGPTVPTVPTEATGPTGPAGPTGLAGPTGPAGPAGPPPLGSVSAAFVSLARPGVPEALERWAALGARRIAVVPYFLFDGVLVERIRDQVASWAADRPGCTAVTGTQMGTDPRLVALVWSRYDEARSGAVHMNCDGCLYRAPLPGYEQRVGAPPLG